MPWTTEELETIRSLREGVIFNLRGQKYRKLEGTRIESLPEDIPKRPPTYTTPTNTDQYSSSTPKAGLEQYYENRKSKNTAADRNNPPPPEQAPSRGGGRRHSVSQNRPTADRESPQAPAARRQDPALSDVRRKEDVRIPIRPRDLQGGTPDPGYSDNTRDLATTLRPSKRDISPLRNESRISSSALATGQNRPSRVEEQEEKDDEPEFSVLVGAARAFASFPQNDFRRRAAFLANNTDLLKSRFDDFLREAVHQIVKHYVAAAVQSMQSLVILRLCEDVKTKYIESEVAKMQQQDTEQHDDFQRMYEEVCRTAQAIAQAKSQGESRRHGRHDSKLDESAYIESDASKAPLRPRGTKPPEGAKDLFEGMTEGAPGPVKMDTALMEMDPNDFQTKEMRTLSAQYRTPENGRTFFIPGRVFSLIWHENAGEPRSKAGRSKPAEFEEREKAEPKDRIDPNITIGPFGERIYSHIRRMVVIRNRKGYCWCVGINSYGKSGLSKSGLKDEEIKAHTIVHDRRYKPAFLPAEPKTFKKPLAVDMKSGQTLSTASRLHYGKPYMVEWNTKVMDVGQIVESSMSELLANAAWELLGHRTQP